jgi:hypothetical protein
MAGRGPAPGANPNRKDPSRRARRNSTDIQFRVIAADPATQPQLPEGVWHPQTIEWWRMWGESPLATEFTENDWSELLAAALIHSAFWSGDMKVAAELRQRVAKFGATPEDRARLRIQFAQADEADAKRTEPAGGVARGRRGPLTALPDSEAG